MNWTDADKRMLAQYLAELNGGVVVYKPRPIIGPLLDWAGAVLAHAIFGGPRGR